MESEGPKSHPDDSARAAIVDACDRSGAFKAVTSADTRRQLIELAEQLVEEMKAVGEWRASLTDF